MDSEGGSEDGESHVQAPLDEYTQRIGSRKAAGQIKAVFVSS
jgi:hypothetical protein